MNKFSQENSNYHNKQKVLKIYSIWIQEELHNLLTQPQHINNNIFMFINYCIVHCTKATFLLHTGKANASKIKETSRSDYSESSDSEPKKFQDIGHY